MSDAVGGIAKPWQIERVANAEAKADLIRAQSKIEISELERRALERMVREEGQKQQNIESITYKATQELKEEAKPENIEKDWLTDFFDKARNTSNEEMQSLWAKILAGEANSPGSFSKRTVAVIASLNKRDAELFTKFCVFCCSLSGLTPLIFNHSDEIYRKSGINFDTLNHLASLGLINFMAIGNYQKEYKSNHVIFSYYGRAGVLEGSSDLSVLSTGSAMLTQIGRELALICGSTASDEFYDYVISQWKKQGYTLKFTNGR